MELIAHRGSQGLMPENTIEAFKKAIALGCLAIDADLVVTKDRVVVVYHDLCLNPQRTKDAAGKFVKNRTLIKELTFAELQDYSVGELKHSRVQPQAMQLAGVKIPSLGQLFQFLNQPENMQVAVNLEFKNCPNFPELTVDREEFADLTLALIAEFHMEKRVFLQSFDWLILRYLQNKTTTAPLLPISSLSSFNFDANIIAYLLARYRWTPREWPRLIRGLTKKVRWIDWFQNYSDSTVPLSRENGTGIIVDEIERIFGRRGIWSPDFKDLSEQAVKFSHRRGLKVYAWTVTTASDTKKALDWQVDAIFHDRIDVGFEVIGAESSPGQAAA